MKNKLVTAPGADAANELAVAPLVHGPEGFIDAKELARRLNCSVGTISNWRKSGKLPWINSPGRLVLFDWPSVREALLRMQRNSPK